MCVCVVHKQVFVHVLSLNGDKVSAQLFIRFGDGGSRFASIESFIDLFPINGQP